MSHRSELTAIAALLALTFAVSPAPACERHQQQTTSISEATTVPPAPPAAEPAAPATLAVSPAAAALSVAEGLGSETYAMRCLKLRNLQQALTQ
jgi:hypothetical protein